MTATESFRQLLDERGVEWTYSDGTVSFDNGERWFHAWAYNDGAMCVSMGYLTPEQAIEATLGRGTCRDKGNIERFICSECECRLDLQDEDWEPTMWLDGAAMVPRFCPNCGRVIKQ